MAPSPPRRGVRDPRARPRRPVPAVVELPCRPGHRLGQDVDHRSPVHQLGVLSILQPITDLLEALVRWTQDVLDFLGWPGIFIATALIAYRAAGRVALVCVGCLAAIGILGVWFESTQTMSLMIVAVAISLLIGVPLGIMAGRHPKIDGALAASSTPRRRCRPTATCSSRCCCSTSARRRGDRHRDLRPRPSGAPTSHGIRSGRAGSSSRRGARRDQPPGPQQGAVAGGPPGHPPRRQPGDRWPSAWSSSPRSSARPGSASPCSTASKRSTSAWPSTQAWPSCSSPSSSTGSLPARCFLRVIRTASRSRVGDERPREIR